MNASCTRLTGSGERERPKVVECCGNWRKVAESCGKLWKAGKGSKMPDFAIMPLPGISRMPFSL